MARKPSKPKLPKLTAPERDVLQVLTEGRKTTGPVRIASDLYQRGHHRGFTFGDPVGLVTLLLEELADKGLVKYSEPGAHDHAPEGYHGLPFDVRLTPLGWEVAGYPHIHSEVGTSSRHLREVNPADSVDYRNYMPRAEGGDIERLPWREHRAKYPAHTHGYALFEAQEGEQVALMATRPYVKVTPELEQRVMSAYIRLGDYAKTAAETNVTERQVRYIVKDRPVLNRDTGSLKMRVLALIRDRGPYPDVASLHADIPGPHGLHNLVHILHSLHKAQFIDFREDRSNGTGVNYLRIRATIPTADADFAALDEPDILPEAEEKHAEAGAEGAEGSDTQAVTAVALTVGPTYPELARVRALSAQLEAEAAKASQYLAAAELLTTTDPETAELLLSKAAEAETQVLSPVESEYLRYAEVHADGDEAR